MPKVNYFDTVRRHTIKVEFDNGDIITTEINGTTEDIVKCYIGTSFNLGMVQSASKRINQ